MARRLPGLMLIALLAWQACATAAEGPRVFAASSLNESLTAVATAWSAHGHVAPVLSFDASSTLARRIEAGERTDLFLSADEEWMDYLEQRNLLREGTRVDLLSNRLVLIAPVSSPLRARIVPGMDLAAATGGSKLALADPDNVPAGRYAREALQKLGVWDTLAGRIASAENVRAALTLVEREEAPLGIVYATDARASRLVRVLDTFPTDTHAPILYPLALLRAGDNPEARAFYDFLLSREGRMVFASFGFIMTP
jgi:molybdate transport system substrate-binding protein